MSAQIAPRLTTSRLFATLFAAMLIVTSAQATDIIQTLAGGGSLEGYKPDQANLGQGGSGLGLSQGLAISPIGELYVSDSFHNEVLRINPTTGRISVFAGDGTQAYFGDNTPAPSAGLNSPGGLAFDSKGNLLIADRGNFVVRRVDAVSNIITTVAGNGLFTNEIVGANPPAGLGDGGQALQATFSTLMGAIIIDSTGNVIVADTGNACVRKFTIGGTIATIAGTPQTPGFAGDGGAATAALLNKPTGLAIDSSGNLFIGEFSNRRVRQVDGSGTITTVAGTGVGTASGFSGDGGPPLAADIGSLGGMAFDSAKRLVISCVGANRIRRVDFTIPQIDTIAGAGNGGAILGDLGPATGAALAGPTDVAIDSSGNIYIYDAGFGRIRRVDAATGFIDTVIGTGVNGMIGDRGPRQFMVLNGPLGASFDAPGNLFIADTNDNSVRKVALDGTVTTYAGTGNPTGLGDGGPATLASLNMPNDVLVVGTTLFIADTTHNRIRASLITSNGNSLSTFAMVTAPAAIVANAAGVLFVCSRNQIVQVATDGTTSVVVGSAPVNTKANPLGDGLPAANANLSGPSALALGPNGDLYIADTNHNTIRLIRGGITSTFAGGGATVFPAVGDGGLATAASLSGPQGVTLDAAGARLIVSDSGDNRIRAIDLASNIITTIAGTGTAGLVGDGDVALNAQVNNPAHIFVNAGALVFADTGNNRIRRIVTAPDITPKLLAFTAKLDFSVDKKTGLPTFGKDSVSLKAGLALPAGITAANLPITVDIVDLHQSVQLDAKGKQPKVVKAKAPKPVKGSKTTTAKGGTPVFNFTLPSGQTPPVSTFSLSLKGTSAAGGKPTSFSFGSKGTFREELGRAGFTDVTTAKNGVMLPLRIDITLGSTVFTGTITVVYKAQQGKSGAATAVKLK